MHRSKRRRMGVLRSQVGFMVCAAALCTLPLVANAGIFRDVLSSVGLSKPEAAPSGANGVPSFPRSGFACCNLRFSKDWINDGNYAELPMIPAGTPVDVLNYGRHRANVKIDGRPYRLGHDYGRDQESLDVWANKIVVNSDPRPRINSYPAAVQDAIRQGKVMVGMTREQAIVAVGYPMTSENPSTDSNMWRIWRSSHDEYDLHWGPDGHLTAVTGDDAVLGKVLFKPNGR